MTASVSAPARCRADAQHARGRLTARERLALLLDPGSMTELAAGAATDASSDGVVTVQGRIAGRTVCVFAKDFGSAQGTLNELHARKIGRLQEQALRNRVPLIGLYDTAGLRLEAGLGACTGFAEIARRAARAQGVIPQLAVVLGTCPGADALLASLADIVLMANDDSALYVSGADVARAVAHEEVDTAALGGPSMHARESGLADGVCDNDVQALLKVRRLFAFLPARRSGSWRADAAPWPCLDDVAREAPALDTLIPDQADVGYDVKELIRELADAGDFMELQPEHAANLIVGFVRLDGRSVGVVANQSSVLAGVLDDAAARKAARFVRFCDAFGLPLLNLVDAPGFLPGAAQEQAGLARHAAELLAAQARARVPMVTVVLRRAFGAAGVLMGSRALGADMVYAWPQAQIGLVGVPGAVALGASETEAARALAPATAAGAGEVDEVIAPRKTRERVIRALAQLAEKNHLQRESHVL
ncbi:MAG TPA: carboxyl transferase domain-containing protein [Ramlibacter sp.]|nr:carboxyl transferase domain-containing protein [Ramlibacter sp.]